MQGEITTRVTRLFAQWVIVNFGHFFGKITEVAIFDYFFPRLSLRNRYFDQKWVGLQFGEIFTNSSGHHDHYLK
jgi:hypothetical protein